MCVFKLICAVISLLVAFSTLTWLVRSRKDVLKRGIIVSCWDPLYDVPIRARCSISDNAASSDGGMRSTRSRSVSEPYSDPE